MTIKRLQTGQASFPRIGILRKGAPKPANGNKPGADLEYFRFDPEDGPERAEILAQFQEAFGDEPRDIEVFLPYATPAENFEAWQEEWVAGGLMHRCDGETMVIWRDKAGGYNRTPQPCKGGCAPVGRLKVIIPALRRMAYVTVQTTSINDILTLDANLAAAHMLRGDLRGIPFILKRRPREISTPSGNGNRVRREKWLLSIEAKPSWVELQLQAMERAALPAGTLALPDGRHMLDTETGEVIEVSAEETEAVFAEGKPATEHPTEPHWTRDAERVARFWAKAAEKGVTPAMFFMAADTSSQDLSEYTGTPEDAWAIVKVAAQKPAAPPWTHDQQQVAAFIRWGETELGVGATDILTGLNVTAIEQYTGSVEQAKALVRKMVVGVVREGCGG
jgi:hypothetical protein